MEGAAGRVACGYQPAADLGPWTLEATGSRDGRRWAVRATVLRADSYWLAQAPLRLALHAAWDVLEWPDAQVAVDGRVLRMETNTAPLVRRR